MAKTAGKQASGQGKDAKASANPARSRPVGKRAAKPPAGITPEQALENTRKLLEAKHEQDRQTPVWQQLDGSHAAGVQGGYQSDEAAAKAAELHAAESRLQAIQGSIGTQDRHNQGKRDNR
ncbi:hypothetical protein [Luteimonas mephitis]|uniref:hypothetical protein n=1 Tax=Luteimonas mephitis TaxID=83615 RepID=UPI0012EC3A2E|nr:hypothetical protein [Luteimonas mephitis]